MCGTGSKTISSQLRPNTATLDGRCHGVPSGCMLLACKERSLESGGIGAAVRRDGCRADGNAGVSSWMANIWILGSGDQGTAATRRRFVRALIKCLKAVWQTCSVAALQLTKWKTFLIWAETFSIILITRIKSQVVAYLNRCEFVVQKHIKVKYEWGNLG